MRLTKREPVRKGLKQANGQQSELGAAIRGHHRRHPSGAPLRSAHIVNNKEDHSQHFKAPQASPTLSYSMDLHRCGNQGLAHLSSLKFCEGVQNFSTAPSWRGDGETRDSKCCAKNLVADAKTKMSKMTHGLEFKLFYGDNEDSKKR
jgi:hypothetical protein